jgi:hypothetical protein
MPFDLAAVRELLAAALGDDELSDLCFDRFPLVHGSFAAGQTRGARIRLLVDHAARQRQLDRLLAAVRAVNPRAYAEFESRLGASPRESDAVSAPLAPPAAVVPTAPVPHPSPREVPMPRLQNHYALLAGIANYPRVNPLPPAILQDGRDMRDLLASPSSCGYPKDNVRLLLDAAATADGLRQGLTWLAGTAGPDATAVFFFSGHGGRVKKGRSTVHYLIPYDCDPDDLDHTALSGQELTGLLRQVRAARLLVFFDCCYAGGTGATKGLAAGRPDFKAGLEERYYQQLGKGAGRVIMASSRADETSLVLPGMANSLFTHYLLEALRGQAATRGDDLIRVFDVFHYVSVAVPQRDSRQHPIFKADDLENNFAVALCRGGKGTASEPTAPPRTDVDLSALRKAVARHYSLADLGILCADVEQALRNDDIDLAVDAETVGGTTKEGIVLNLIAYLQRRGYLAYLVTAVDRDRPGLL